MFVTYYITKIEKVTTHTRYVIGGLSMAFLKRLKEQNF